MDLAACLLLALVTRAAAAPTPPPRVMLWAWERPGDLRGLPPHVGVAFLAATVQMRGPQLRTVPRLQQLLVSPDTYRMPVVRIECSPGSALSNSQRAAAVDAIVDTVRITKAKAVQVDFDARLSERNFYRGLLTDLRAKLGPGIWLSITALVSWCGDGSWLANLPVDETVAMAFEMGQSAANTETLLASGGDFHSPACRVSIGVAVPDLGVRRRPRRDRVYLFSYQDWTPANATRVLERLP